MTMKLIYIQCFYDSIKLFKVFYTFTLIKFAQLNNCHHYTWEFQENTLYLAYNREEADSVETRRIRDFISSSVVIPGFLYVESLYWDGWQGHFPWRRGTSQQLPHFHKPAKNWNRCLRYCTGPWFQMYKYGYNHYFFYETKPWLYLQCTFSINQKKKPVLIMLFKSKFLLSISFNFKSKI